MGRFETYINQKFQFEWALDVIFTPDQHLVILDVGACEGEDTIRFSRKYKNATIYTFEPLPENIDKIYKNFSNFRLPLDGVYPIALSNFNGVSSFFVSSGQPNDPAELKDKQWDHGNKSSSLLRPARTRDIHPWLKFNQAVSVTTSKFSDVAKREGISSIDFVYMDVQGAERLVLEGFGSYIYNTKMIWLEVENLELYQGQPLREDIEAYMKNRGFIKIMDTVNDVAGDQLYVNSLIVDISIFENSKLKGVNNSSADEVLPTPSVNVFRSRLRSGARKIRHRNFSLNSIKIIDPDLSMLVEDRMLWAFPGSQYYETSVDYWLRRLIISNPLSPVLYDIGANYGYYSLVAGRLGAEVYSFEPVNGVRSCLMKNAKKNKLQKSINTLQFALSDRAGTDTINLYSSSGNNSIAKRSIPDGHELKYIGTQKIIVNTLDNLVNKYSMQPPSLLKIDVEGHEQNVLSGAEKTIRRYMPDIIVEYSEATSKDSGYKRTDILKWLQKMGYSVFGLISDSQIPSLLTGKEINSTEVDNLLAVRKKRIREIGEIEN